MKTRGLKITAKSKTEEIQGKIRADKCSLRKGVYTAKWFYFYTHGMTTEKCENKVHKAFPNAEITKSQDCWNAWPKDSWFEVRFTL